MAVLDKVYRELMILGFISLGVVFANVRFVDGPCFQRDRRYVRAPCLQNL
eukprot:COSAG01_NODE_71074_length_257_cov_0.575949_1_plen_49_part_01